MSASTSAPFTLSLLSTSPVSFSFLDPNSALIKLKNWILGTLSLVCLLLAALLWVRPSSSSLSVARSSPPIIPTWPWFGSLLAYTRDPVSFIRRNHARYGDAFTTTILGYRCTFIQSAPHVHRFATAPRTVLDVTSAYKLIASGVIGEEAFIGPTPKLTRLVLAPARIDGLDDRLWDLAKDMMGGRLDTTHAQEWTALSPTGWLDHVVFALDLAALLGPSPPELLPTVASLFRVLDADLSLLGLFTAARARARAKDKLIGLLRSHVRGHLELAARRAGSCEGIMPDPELPEVLLRAELETEVGAPDELLWAYHTGTATTDMLETLERKVNFIALFIYGFVWAAQTNSAAATIGVLYDIFDHRRRTGEDLVGEIRAEFEQAGGVGQASYRQTSCLTRCINETLRLRATGGWVRLAAEPFRLADGQTCPPGFIVASPTSISFNECVYVEPHVWNPSRYLRPPFAPGEGSIALDSRTWLPSPSRFPAWGVGHAHCPGQHLAYKMISVTLLTFFHHFDARLVRGDPSPVFQDVAAAGLQRLKSDYKIEIRKR
ncbi:hypothetical protein CROQUDRAFT_42414 [Cronartium quercuum f. sp. fusiforme G11]|uniref:Cytochrome P450 n=1 Tax=Cronartium quercuum f. sp. fusiforme G11 TaxID=708437 RepID=A0A9P6TDG3_9BASI|nr:hypothetical protein CROQUDRAFT_42414 [Cronartium quercuum f. sp. fusiforme G11]